MIRRWSVRLSSGQMPLARRLSLPTSVGASACRSSDSLSFWRPSPRPTDEEESTRHAESIRSDPWIISGDYRYVASVRVQAADMVVWLGLPRSTSLFRATVKKLRGNRSLTRITALVS